VTDFSSSFLLWYPSDSNFRYLERGTNSPVSTPMLSIVQHTTLETGINFFDRTNPHSTDNGSQDRVGGQIDPPKQGQSFHPSFLGNRTAACCGSIPLGRADNGIRTFFLSACFWGCSECGEGERVMGDDKYYIERRYLVTKAWRFPPVRTNSSSCAVFVFSIGRSHYISNYHSHSERKRPTCILASSAFFFSSAIRCLSSCFALRSSSSFCFCSLLSFCCKLPK